jgi:16S rRNA (uracil1498-N3)-methyltransferase
VNLFYVEDIPGDILDLPETESYHISRVLRLKPGEKINLTDGKGNLFLTTIERIDKKYVSVIMDECIREYEKRNYYLHIAIAPTKNLERFEWFAEKATEIGVDEITPLVTEHSERRKLRYDRIEKIMIAAMKQSLKAYKPQLNPIIKFGQFLENFNFTGEKYIATCMDTPRLGIDQIYTKGKDATVIIGPEGDFSPEELKIAFSKDFQAISLGNSRLRTETAGVVTCYAVHLLNLTTKPILKKHA